MYFKFRGAVKISKKRKRIYGALSAVAGVPLALALTGAVIITPFGAIATGEGEVNDRLWAEQILADAGIDYAGEIVIYDELLVAGVQAAGYVPILNDEDTINVVSSAQLAAYGPVDEVFRSVVLHEYAHILQKKVIEEHCGDYYAARAVCVTQLNDLLTSYIGDATHPETTVFPGLETGADCILDTYSRNAVNIHGYQEGSCSTQQLAAALAIRAGEWPDENAVIRWTPEAETLEDTISKNLSKATADLGKKSGYLGQKKKFEEPGGK